MCDFSLHAVRSRPAKVGDKLTTRMFTSGTTGFCARKDNGMALCLLPGTELSFADEVRRATDWPWKRPTRTHEHSPAPDETHDDAAVFLSHAAAWLSRPNPRTQANYQLADA